MQNLQSSNVILQNEFNNWIILQN